MKKYVGPTLIGHSASKVLRLLVDLFSHLTVSRYTSKLAAIVLLFLSVASTQPLYAQLQPNSLLLVDPAGGSGSRGALLVVDPTTGNRTVFSDFGSASQGPLGAGPCSVAVLGAGDALFVLDNKAGTNRRGVLFKVDPGSGIRQTFTDFGNSAQGALGVSPNCVATTNGILGTAAAILVIDSRAGTNGYGALFSVDPITQTRSIVSDLGNSSQGPLGVQCVSVIAPAESLGLILVVDSKGGTNQHGAILVVNPLNGQRTLMSDFGNPGQGPVGAHPVSAALSPGILGLSNTILILDSQAGSNAQGALFVLDASGSRTLLSDFGNYIQGPNTRSTAGGGVQQLAVVSGTQILVTDSSAGLFAKGALFSIDPSSGFRGLLADFAESLEGPTVTQNPIGIGWWP